MWVLAGQRQQASPQNAYVVFGFQILSPWYTEFLDEEDYWFLAFTVGGSLSWGGIMRLREEKGVTALSEVPFPKVNEILSIFLSTGVDGL